MEAHKILGKAKSKKVEAALVLKVRNLGINYAWSFRPKGRSMPTTLFHRNDIVPPFRSFVVYFCVNWQLK